MSLTLEKAQNLIEAEFKKIDDQVKNLVDATNEEVEKHGKIGVENKKALEGLNETLEEVNARIQEIEQQGGLSVAANDDVVESVGAQFTSSESFKNFAKGDSTKAKFEVENNTIIGSDTTVAPERRAGVVPGATRRLRMQEIMSSIPTSSNNIEYVRENAFTDNAAEQSGEGELLAESDLTFSLASAPVRTIGHFILLSKQMLEDGPAIAGYTDTRLRYGVERRLDGQIAVGDGAGQNLSGVLNTGNFSAFTPTAGDPAVESVRKAMTQLELQDYYASAVLMNPSDVEAIDLDTDNDDAFRAANPRDGSPTTIWGLPIVSTSAVAANQFALGAFDMATLLHMRRGTLVEMSDSDNDNFQRELVTLKATIRAALEINTVPAIVGGVLTA